jgi:hypothetical protein
MLQTEGWPGGWSTTLDEEWYLSGQARPPERITEEHERLRAEMSELTEMLSTGRACLTSVGWLDQVVQGERDAFDGFHLRIAHAPKVYAAARWYAHEAMCAEDPRLALCHLDRLCRAISHPGIVHDRMQSIMVRKIRDRTFLRLLLRRPVDVDLVEAWLRAPSREIERLAQEIRIDRTLYGMTVGTDLAEERHLDWNEDIDLDDRFHLWWRGAGDVASWLELCHAFEGYLRGTGSPDEVRRLEAERQARKGRPLATDEYHSALLEQAVLGNVQHRLPRIAAFVLRCIEDKGRLPGGTAELRGWMGEASSMLDPGAFHLALTYDRLADDAFRVRVDPETPIPALFRSSAMDRLRTEQSSENSRDTALRWLWSHTLEVHVPRP